MKSHTLTLALILGSLLGSMANAGDNPHVWSPKTKSIAVFKNGLAFFHREGEVTLRDGWAHAEKVPPAKFGTLAIFSNAQSEWVDIVGSGPGEITEFDDRHVAVDKRRERLLASLHLKIQLTYDHAGKEAQAMGELVSVGPQFAILETGSSNLAIPVDAVKAMQILEMPLRVHVSDEGDKNPEKTTLSMAYLREGITWIPEYTLRIIDEQTAELTLRGTLINEAEDLVHCDVNFVVGVPHFAHSSYQAPVAVGQVIRAIGASVVPSQIQGQIRNRAAFTNNMVTSNIETGAIDIPVLDQSSQELRQAMGNLPQMGTATRTDYTVYTKSDLTIRRGEKAIVTLFTKKIQFGHLYDWSPPARMEHSLVLQNDTDSAWTTGPCLVVDGEQPLGEDLLKYTPRGGKAKIPVSSAINIYHEKSEVEVERRLKSHSPSREVFFDLVTLEGTLELRNFERESVPVEIEVKVPGKPTVASEDGKLSTDPTKLRLLEREGRVRWKVTIPAGETRMLTYRYERFVKSN